MVEPTSTATAHQNLFGRKFISFSSYHAGKKEKTASRFR
jgi:hypothetical protein